MEICPVASLVILALFIITPLKDIELPFFKENVPVVEYNGEEYEMKNDEIPLKREDLSIQTYKFRSTSKEVQESVLAKFTQWKDQSNDDPGSFNMMKNEVSYSLFECNSEWLTEKYFHKTYEDVHYIFYDNLDKLTEIDSSAWGAKKAYIVDGIFDKIVIVYDTKILELSENIRLSDVNIRLLKNKLGL